MRTEEAGTGTESDAPVLPADRYGRRVDTASRRWRRWLFLAIALVVGGVVAYVAYVNLGEAPIDAERVAFQNEPGNAMQVTLNVTRDDPSRAGVCVVRVRDQTGAESGRREVLVPANRSRVSTVVKSIGAPVTADVYGCSYDIPRYMSTP